MKVKVEDLERVVKWMRTNSPDIMVNIREVEKGLQFTCKDKYQTYVEMKVAEEGIMSPKIIKEENIP